MTPPLRFVRGRDVTVGTVLLVGTVVEITEPGPVRTASLALRDGKVFGRVVIRDDDEWPAYACADPDCLTCHPIDGPAVPLAEALAGHEVRTATP